MLDGNARATPFLPLNKIFGVGANKTGTGSVTAALDILGFKVSHWDHHQEILHGLIHCTFRFDFLEEYAGATDLPIPSIYKELDKSYPNSKFILTIRDIDSWLRSEENHHRRLGFEKPCFEVFLLYGSFFFDREKFRKAYVEHNNEVREYFRDRPDDLLTIDVANGEGWEKLCPFLDKSIPDVPFPHVNRGNYARQQRKLLEPYRHLPGNSDSLS